MSILIFTLLPIISGVILFALPKKLAKIPIISWIITIEITLILFSIYIFNRINKDGIITSNIGSKISLVGISLKIDRISIIMIMVTILVFSIVFLFTCTDYYFDKVFVLIFFVLEGLLCGIFESDDLFNIYVLYEVSTIVVSILIMYKKDGFSIYDGMIYLITNIITMLIFLLGIGYIYKIFGVLNISEIERLMIEIEDKKVLIMPFSLIFTSLSVKCAMFPLFSWLPTAHGTPSAPGGVSAILSGVYINSGIYLFIVFKNMFATIDMSVFFMTVSFLTGIIGIIFALGQRDIKLILAYSTISQIGLIMMGICFGKEISFYGSVYHIINHSIFKSTLFLTSGIIIKKYETRNIEKISNAKKEMPLIFIVTLISVLGITGTPFFSGSVSKYFIQYGIKGSFWESGVMIINLGTILVFIRYMSIFFGNKKEIKNIEKIQIHKTKNIAIGILSSTCILSGFFGFYFINLLFNVNLDVEIKTLIPKYAIYTISLGLAFLIYIFLIQKKIGRILLKLNYFTITFDKIVLLIITYFGVIMFFTYANLS